jgi:hypothetical protein
MDLGTMTIAELEKEHQARDLQVVALREEMGVINKAIIAKEQAAFRKGDPRLAQSVAQPDVDMDAWAQSLPGEVFTKLKSYFGTKKDGE